MRKRIVSNITENLKSFAKDYFYFQLAIACSAVVVAIMFFIMKSDERSFIIAAVCCLAGAFVYVAKAYMSLLLFHGLGELIETNKKILKELGAEVDEEEEQNKKEVKLDRVYDAIEYYPETRLKKMGKVFIRERFVSVASKHISFKDITVFDKGNDLLENYGFDDLEYTVYHIKADGVNYYFSIADRINEKLFRQELHEKLTAAAKKNAEKDRKDKD